MECDLLLFNLFASLTGIRRVGCCFYLFLGGWKGWILDANNCFALGVCYCCTYEYGSTATVNANNGSGLEALGTEVEYVHRESCTFASSFGGTYCIDDVRLFELLLYIYMLCEYLCRDSTCSP